MFFINKRYLLYTNKYKNNLSYYAIAYSQDRNIIGAHQMQINYGAIKL